MQIERADLERHYASLSDEALLEIKPEELMELAQECHAAEVRARGLSAKRPRDRSVAASVEPEEGEADTEEDWIADDAGTANFVTVHTSLEHGEAADMRDALEHAGIPCVLEISANAPGRRGVSRILVRVAPDLKARAETVLAERVLNPVHEETYRTFFESLDDDDLATLDLSTFVTQSKQNRDLIARVRASYLEELDRRELPHPQLDEAEQKASEPDADSEWSEAATSLSALEAQLAEQVLANAGIPYRVQGDPAVEFTSIDILVSSAQYETACQILEEQMTEQALETFRLAQPTQPADD